MYKDMVNVEDAGYVDLARRLEAFADLRLSPSLAATTRMRMNVMNAAHRRAALIEADATFGAAGETTAARAAKRAREIRHAWRRPVGAVLAGCLTLALFTGTAIAARPGGPLYAARVWTEMVNLPGGLVARAEAEVNRLEERLNEAEAASNAGDARATEAALAAYSAIVVEAARGSVGDKDANAAIHGTVTRHVAVLTQMVESVPTPARPAAEVALTSSTTALNDLDEDDIQQTDTQPSDTQPTDTQPSDTQPTQRERGQGATTDPATNRPTERDRGHDVKTDPATSQETE